MQETTASTTQKPHAMRVTLPDGQVRLIGVSAAAKWMGCSRQVLSQMARGTEIYVTQALKDRARKEFPELFTNANT